MAKQEYIKRISIVIDYEPDNNPHLEIYIRDEEKCSNGIYVADLCLPVLKMTNKFKLYENINYYYCNYYSYWDSIVDLP